MIRSTHFRHMLVKPVLERLSVINPRYNTREAEDLLMGTAAQESGLGYNLHQLGGPALGVFQIEKETYLDIVDRYLKRPEHEGLLEIIEGFTYKNTPITEHRQLITNLPLSTAVARIKYWMVPAPIPESLAGQAAYWDKYYNANPDHGTVEQYLENYSKLVKGSD